MKNPIALLFVFVFASVSLIAQTNNTSQRDSTGPENDYVPQVPTNVKKPIENSGKRVFFTLSGGINNPGGIIGLGAQIGFNDQHGLAANAGVGSWGKKFSLQYRVVTKGSWRKGIQFYMGTSVSSGMEGSNEELTLPDSVGMDRVYNISYKTAWTADAGMAIALPLGKSSTFQLLFGFQKSLSIDPFVNRTKTYGLSKDGKAMLNILKPGGLTIAFAFGF